MRIAKERQRGVDWRDWQEQRRGEGVWDVKRTRRGLDWTEQQQEKKLRNRSVGWRRGTRRCGGGKGNVHSN